MYYQFITFEKERFINKCFLVISKSKYFLLKFCAGFLVHKLFTPPDKNDIVNTVNFNEDDALKCLLCFICIYLPLYFHRHTVKITWTLQILRLANAKSYLRQRTIFKYYEVVCYDNEMKPKDKQRYCSPYLSLSLCQIREWQ